MLTEMPASHEDTLELLKDLRAAGVDLWAEGGRLHYRAPKNSLDQHRFARLRRSHNEILRLIAATAGNGRRHTGLVPRAARGPAPLAFTQLQHWNLYQLDHRRSYRFVSRAMRLVGNLDVECLRRSLGELVRRHEALRTRVVVAHSGVPMQETIPSQDVKLEVQDLTGVPEECRESELITRIEKIILQPIDVGLDPLYEVALIRLKPTEHVLVVATEHIITDMASIGIFINDLYLGYVQQVQGLPFSFPKIPIQLADYADWQRREEVSWVAEHKAYWNARLMSCGRLRFPTAPGAADASTSAWEIATVVIPKNLKAQLQEWSRPRNTTPVMSLFTAYVALVLRWCAASQTVIQFISANRTLPQIEHAIGFFAAPLHVPVSFRSTDSFLDLLKRTTEEYCRAHEHEDLSYFEAQVPRPGFTFNSSFNWVPQVQKSALEELEGSENALASYPLLFEQPLVKKLERDSEPFIVIFDTDDDAVASIFFPPWRFPRKTMERFGQNFLAFVEQLLRNPEQLVRDIAMT